MKKIILLIILVGIVGCKQETKAASPAKVTQSQKAAEAANSIKFTENAEIDNIKRRLELTSDPGLTGFILLLNEMGQPIMYTGIKGKITSGGKRLTKPYNVNKFSNLNGQTWLKLDSPSDEGTWGSSNPYIYFWTITGQYIQWNGKYLYSDKPFRTNVKPLILEVK